MEVVVRGDLCRTTNSFLNMDVLKIAIESRTVNYALLKMWEGRMLLMEQGNKIL